MNRIRKILPMLAALALLAVLLCPGAALAVEPIDPQYDGELSIEFVYEGRPVAGAPYCLYRIADISSEGEITLCAPFDAFPVDFENITQEKYRDLAQTLDAYVKLDMLIPDAAGEIDEYGFAVITGLKPGLFLLMGQRYIGEDGLYVSPPTIVSIPAQSKDGQWMYNVRVLPKCTFQPHGGMGVTTKKVIKIWQDEGNEQLRPQSIEVILMCNGYPYETVELNAENGWSYVWQELAAGEEWLVLEVVPEGYSVLISENGLITQIYNTNDAPPPPTEPEPDLPQTGVLWWPLPLLIVMGVVLIVAGIRINRGSKHEA